MTLLNDLKSLPPSLFFKTVVSIPRKNHSLPLTLSPYHSFPHFMSCRPSEQHAKIGVLWDLDNLYVVAHLPLPLEEGDILEIFVNTRDVKNCHVTTCFCHHFMFDLMKKEGIEMTRFRGEDRHRLADSSLFQVTLSLQEHFYCACITLPKKTLHGYDPLEYRRMGMTYRFRKKGGEIENLSVSSDLFSIETQPSLWTSCVFCEGGE